MTRFRIAQNDTIRAHAINKSGKIIATLYDSGFRSKSSVELALMNKIPHYSQSTIEIRIYNEDKEISTRYSISVNQ
jgi:hypothetical protein